MTTNENQNLNLNLNLNPTLPQDIIYETLLYLPVKTLLRCMSVCKSWLSIISSDDFVKTHLSKSTNDPRFTHHHLFIDKYDKYTETPNFNICSVHSLLNETVAEPFKIDSPNKNLWILVGYCNGLVCLSKLSGRVFFWNPSTRKSRKLPRSTGPDMISYYFCYDERENDFKVFGVYSGAGYTCGMFFYSSKSDCWTEIGDFPFNDIHSGVVYAKGAFYWVVELMRHNDDRGTIISLDIKTGTYREVLQPKYTEGTYIANLSTFGKSLYVCYNVRETRTDFWVMNDCCVEESWTKLCTILPGNGITSGWVVYLLCVCGNGDIMLSSKSQILLYKSKDKTCEVLFDIGSKRYEVCTYVESLVSPNFEPEFWGSNK